MDTLTESRTPVLHDVLADLAGKGDQWAMNELVRQFEPLIGKFTWALLPGMESTSAEDLRQIGAVCFIEMVPKYKIEVASFMTFVFRWLPLKMKRESDGNFQDRLVSPPVNKLSKDRARIKRGESPEFIMCASTSINGRTFNGTDGPEQVSDDEFLHFLTGESVECAGEQAATSRIVWATIDALPEADRKVLHLYYKADMSLETIAEIFGVTRQAINTRIAKALATVQYKLGIRDDKPTHTTRFKHLRSIKQATH